MEDIELGEYNRDREADREADRDREADQETSFNDGYNDWMDESMLHIDVTEGTEGISNPRKDAGVMRRAYTEDKKIFLKSIDININEGDGPNARSLFERLKNFSGKKG